MKKVRAKRHLWTEKEIEILKKEYPTSFTHDLAEKYNIPYRSINFKAHRLGLKKDKCFKAEIYRKILSDPNHPFHKTQFKKGNTSYMKGKKKIDVLSPENYEKFKNQQFKKGMKPHNLKEIGHEWTNPEGYILVKVTHGKGKKDYKFKHHIIWEKVNGPIPKNHTLFFKDKNRANTSIGNLMLVTKQDIMKLNTIAQYPSEVRENIILINQLNKILNPGDISYRKINLNNGK